MFLSIISSYAMKSLLQATNSKFMHKSPQAMKTALLYI